MKERVKELLRAERFSTRRMESLSDGVFGFAMTLLVLNIVLPTQMDIKTNAQLWQAIASQQRGFISFVIAFFILAAMWGLHVRQFELLDKVDRRFLFINNVRLLFAILVAFSTGIAASYENLVLARMILPINFLLLAIVSTVQWGYAVKSKPALLSNITPAELRMHNLRSFWFLLFSVVTVIGAYFVGEISFAVFLLMPVVIRLTANKRADDTTSD